MALPDVFANLPGLFPTVPTGIVVGVVPSSDPAFSIEIQRSVGSTASTNFSSLVKLDPVQQFQNGQQVVTGYTDGASPEDNITRYYRARHFANGYTAGAWSRVVGAKPAPLTGVDLNGRNALQVLVVQAAAFQNSGQSTALPSRIRMGNGFIYNPLVVGAGADRRSAYAPVALPRRARLQSIAVTRYYSSVNAGASINELALLRQTSTGQILVADINSTTHFGNQTLSTGLSLTASTSESLFLAVTLGSDVATTASAIRNVTIRYRNPFGLGGDGRGRF